MLPQRDHTGLLRFYVGDLTYHLEGQESSIDLGGVDRDNETYYRNHYLPVTTSKEDVHWRQRHVGKGSVRDHNALACTVDPMGRKAVAAYANSFRF